MQYGKANYERQSNFQQTTIYQLKSKNPPVTSLVLRLAPPVKNQQRMEKGIWERFFKNHFGYKVKIVKRDGGTAEIPQTFQCIERTDRNKNIVQECGECNEVALRKDKMEREEKRLRDEEKKSDQDIATALKYQKQWLRDHNLDGKWHIYAKDPSGKWGILRIGHKCNSRLLERIQDLVKKNIDPLSPTKGVWLVFKRANPENWQDPGDSVEVLMEETEPGSGNYRMKFDTFTEADEKQLEELPDLDTLPMIRKLTADQIRMLVESGGSEEVVKAVFNVSTRQPRDEESPASATDVVKALQGQAPPKQAETAPPPPSAASGEDDEIAKLQAALVAAQAKKRAAAEVKPAVQPPAGATAPKQQVSNPTPTPELQQQLDMDMDSFIAMFEGGAAPKP